MDHYYFFFLDHYFLTVNPWNHLVPLCLVLLCPRTQHPILEAKVYVLIEGINSAALISLRPPFHVWRDIQDQSRHLFYLLRLRIIHVPYGELAPAEVVGEFHSITLPNALWRFNCDTNEAFKWGYRNSYLSFGLVWVFAICSCQWRVTMRGRAGAGGIELIFFYELLRSWDVLNVLKCSQEICHNSINSYRKFHKLFERSNMWIGE